MVLYKRSRGVEPEQIQLVVRAGLELGSPDFKSGALTTRPRCLLIEIDSYKHSYSLQSYSVVGALYKIIFPFTKALYFEFIMRGKWLIAKD